MLGKEFVCVVFVLFVDAWALDSDTNMVNQVGNDQNHTVTCSNVKPGESGNDQNHTATCSNVENIKFTLVCIRVY